MALQEEFEAQGVWLFRWRSYLPLLLIVLLSYPMLRFKYFMGSEAGDQIWEIFCLSVGLFGFLIRAITIGHAPAHTSGRNTKKQVAEKLNTTGMYSIVRHPLYLGNYFMMLGVVLYPRSVWALSIYSLLFWVYYERIMYAEEAFLRRKFGDAYHEWAMKTPAFFPLTRKYVAAEYPFSIKHVLRREYNGFLGFLLSLFLLELLGDFIALHYLEFDLHWAILMSIGVIAWIVLRWLRKHSKVLTAKK